MPRIKLSKRWVTGAALAMLVLTVGAIRACGGITTSEDKSAQESKLTALPMELAVSDVTTVQRLVLFRRLPISGTVTPLVRTSVRSKVAGEVLEVTAREGQSVKRGDVLVRIDTRNQAALVASQQAALEKARADLALAKLNYDNHLRLQAQHFVAQNVVDTSKSAYEAALSGVKVAQAQLDLVNIGMRDAIVHAPIDGVVSRRLTEPGEKISGDAALLDLVDLSVMELQATAPASEIPAVKVGQIAKIRVDGYNERVFEARVERINPTSEPGARAIMMYLSIDNLDGTLRGGMFAQGTLVIEQADGVLAVPTTAVRSEAGQSYVLVLDEGRLRRQDVQLGIAAEEEALVEVRSGLKEGVRILASRLDTLKPGTLVVVKNKPDAAPSSSGS